MLSIVLLILVTEIFDGIEAIICEELDVAVFLGETTILNLKSCRLIHDLIFLSLFIIIV